MGKQASANPAGLRLSAERAQLLVVDIQERLLPRIDGHESMTAQTVRMLRIAREMGLPITVSEQNPQGLGPTVAPIRDAAGDVRVLRKKAFSVCGEAECLEALRHFGRAQVLLVGIETHVCVQQTALDLLCSGFEPFVLADAVGSRTALDREVALERMARAGVVVTTVESAAFDMLRTYDSELFKRVLPHLR
jgi:isochorismate hydrolase